MATINFILEMIVMSMEKCPHCGNEYDTEVYEKCPLCKEEAETEEISVCEADTEENYESSRKTKRILNGIIVILIVLIIAALGRLVYLSLPYNAPNTIKVKNFSVSDVEGTYTDPLSGQYFTFEAKSTDVKIASDAILSDGAKGETITFDGTFVTGYMSDEIQNIAMKNFVIGKNLGEEVPVGEGKVNFPALIAKFKELGYDGTINIEREIQGEKQIEDIKKARDFLEKLI